MADAGVDDLDEVLQRLHELDEAEDGEGLSDIDDSDEDWDDLSSDDDEKTNNGDPDCDASDMNGREHNEESDDTGNFVTVAPTVQTGLPDDALSSPPRSRRRIQSDLVWSTSETMRSSQPFTGSPGVRERTLLSRGPHTPFKCFLQLFPIALMQKIIDWTNLNAKRKIAAKSAQLGAGQSSSSNHQASWKDVTVDEFQTFLGLMITMGVIHLQDIKMYWKTNDWILNIPSFNQIMPRDRFLSILWFLHFCDESEAPLATDPNRDRLFKIRPILEEFQEIFTKVYHPKKEISIDESLIPFKGRVKFRQRILSKRARYGIKVWVLAESSTGYVSRFSIYVGRDPKTHPEVGLASSVVKLLIQPFEESGYNVYLDNFYTSPELFNYLYDKKVFACGTMRANRIGFPKDILIHTKPRLQRGQSLWRMSDQLLAQSWLDNRAVYFLSTIHSPTFPSGYTGMSTVKRRSSRGNPEPLEIPCPPLLKDYNTFMGGVDLNDQIRKHYTLIRRSKTWYRKVFAYILELALHNSRVVYESLLMPEETKRFQGIDSRMNIIHGLIGDTRVKRATVSMPQEERLQNVGDHHPVAVPGQPRDCRVCRKKASVKQQLSKSNSKAMKFVSVSRSCIKCEKCQVHLCIHGTRRCFKLWYTKREYWHFTN